MLSAGRLPIRSVALTPCHVLQLTQRVLRHSAPQLRSSLQTAGHYTHGLRHPSSPSRTQITPTMASLVHSHKHSGHSHSHHHHDNTYLTSTNRRDAGVRITRIGLFVNIFMAVGKGLGGWVFNSQALIADAFHALTDLVSDFMTLGTVAWALKPPTARFPSGYGKIESLGSLGVSGLLLTGGVLMGLNSCNVLCDQFLGFELLHTFHSHSHGIPDWNAAYLAAGSIVIKEWLYQASKSSDSCHNIWILTLATSHQDSKRAQILRPGFQCCAPSDRLSDKHRCPGCNHWFAFIWCHLA